MLQRNRIYTCNNGRDRCSQRELWHSTMWTYDRKVAAVKKQTHNEQTRIAPLVEFAKKVLPLFGTAEGLAALANSPDEEQLAYAKQLTAAVVPALDTFQKERAARWKRAREGAHRVMVTRRRQLFGQLMRRARKGQAKLRALRDAKRRQEEHEKEIEKYRRQIHAAAVVQVRSKVGSVANVPITKPVDAIPLPSRPLPGPTIAIAPKTSEEIEKEAQKRLAEQIAKYAKIYEELKKTEPADLDGGVTKGPMPYNTFFNWAEINTPLAEMLTGGDTRNSADSIGFAKWVPGETNTEMEPNRVRCVSDVIFFDNFRKLCEEADEKNKNKKSKIDDAIKLADKFNIDISKFYIGEETNVKVDNDDADNVAESRCSGWAFLKSTVAVSVFFIAAKGASVLFMSHYGWPA